jgi:hypothetical protein
MSNSTNLDSLINNMKASPNNASIPSFNAGSKRLFGGRKKFRGGGNNIPLNNIPINSNIDPQVADTMQKLAQATMTNKVNSMSDSFTGGRIIRKRKSKRRKSKRRKSKRSIYSIL